ncbi:MAG TPA: DMT family transporter [Planctomycetota bacterium]|nr:DMT family transporter [Planctomycetota bacterium]
MSYLVYVVGAMFMWGLWGFLPRVAVSKLDATGTLIYTWLGGCVLMIPIVIAGRERLFAITAANEYFPYVCAMVAGCASMVGSLLYNKALALSLGNTAVVIGISALYPVVTILLAVVFLREKMNIGQIVGVLLCVGGAVLLAMSSGTPKEESKPVSQTVQISEEQPA